MGTKLDSMTQEEFMQIVNKLYHKYVEPGSALYEINIGAAEQFALASILDDRSRYTESCQVKLPPNDLKKTMQIIMPILDDIMDEIFKLLQSSFCRFRQTEQWAELCSSLQNI